MTTAISSLPHEVVNLIAAGEVIDSLAAAVRELVENAIDANATRITILVDLDQWTLRVTDNGQGMGVADLLQAALPHSTSKIRTSQDLWQITSLGFRGEALHSLAQLAHLSICSCPSDMGTEAVSGWQVDYDHQGQAIAQNTVAIAPGTIVTIRHLFAPWPGRRQVLPPRSQQLRHIQRTIQHFALCHPHITWQVEQRISRVNGDRPWFSLYPGPTAKTILPQLIRNLHPSDLREKNEERGAKKEERRERNEEQREKLKTQNSKPSTPPSPLSPPHSLTPPLYLLLGLPDRCHRHRPDWINVAINGRVVRSPDLEQTIIGAFRRTLPRDRHPICFVHLQVPPTAIDWNRHPAKLDIYLDQLDHWRNQMREAIAHLLALNLSSGDSFYSERVHQLLKTAEATASYGRSEDGGTRNEEIKNEERGMRNEGIKNEEGGTRNEEIYPRTHAPTHPLTSLKAIAQVRSTYILAEHPAGMWLIEQHIAHERVLYEQLCDRWQVVDVETPITLPHLTPAQVEQLQRINLTVDEFGPNLWAVRTIPQALLNRDDCTDALLELSLGGDMEGAIVATACRTAIRNGTELSLPFMQTLLDDWQRTRQPHTCPHGRPIYLVLEESSLSRFFRRHWVIGKSHGI